MQFLCFLILLIGVAKCDDVVPASYEHLSVPNAGQYITEYETSIQTAYVTSVECMRSSSYYIESGFSEIDSASNDLATNLITQFKNTVGSVENMILGLQSDADKESQEKINAVVSMTVNYYQKKEVTVEKTETKLGEITQVEQAKSILTARRCESDYTSFMSDVKTVKSMYASQTGSSNQIDANQWGTLVNQYYDAREKIVNNTNVYASIRDAFLHGSGINLCEGSANTDESLLEIYKADDLSKYFSKTDNDASALLCQTVTQMYKIYKNSLTVIYLKSVVHSKSDLAMRVTIWEQVNLVRANFEYMSQNIDSFIKSTKTDAESTYKVDSEEYKTIMITLYTCVNKMLLTVVKSTEVHYKRALNFNPDRSMIKTDFNQYKVDVIEKYYEDTLSSNNNALRYDMRVIDKDHSTYPSQQMCIPQDMYSLVVNKLVFQSVVCQFNYMIVQIKSTQYDKTTLDSWIYEKITLVEVHHSFVFSKCSVNINKMFIMNSATYTYILMQTDQSTESNEVQQILDQTSNDVLGALCVHTLRITETYKSVSVFVDKNGNANTSPVVYKPMFNGNTGKSNTGQPPQPNGGSQPQQPNGGSQPPTSGSGTYSPQPSGPENSNTGTPPNSGSSTPTSGSGTYSPQPSGPENSNTGTPPNSGSSTPTSGSGTYSPQPSGPENSNTGTPPNSGSPSTPGTGTPGGNTPTSGGNNYPKPGGSENNNQGNGNGPNNGYTPNVEFTYVKSGIQITKTIEYYSNAIQSKITSSLTNVQNTDETEYTKVVKKSLEIGQEITKYNVDYLDSTSSDSIKYISDVTTIDSDDYLTALIAIFRDTQEKTSILAITMEIPCRRTVYQITSTEYVYLNQSVVYSDFVQNFYEYFEVNCEEIYNSGNDADLFLTNSITQFNKIYEMVVTAVQKTPDEPYKQFLLCYLEKTIAVYKQTTECFKEQIVQTKDLVNQQGDSSKFALLQEIMQRMDCMTVIYSSVLIKSYQYSTSDSADPIFKSEFDIVTVETNIVKSYEYKVEASSLVEIEIST